MAQELITAKIIEQAQNRLLQALTPGHLEPDTLHRAKLSAAALQIAAKERQTQSAQNALVASLAIRLASGKDELRQLIQGSLPDNPAVHSLAAIPEHSAAEPSGA